MTIKRIVAAAVAAVTVGTLGVTAFAVSDPTNSFSFSLEGRDDLYFDISNGVYKSNWNSPAVVEVTYSNLSPTNRAYISVAGDRNWPESYVLSEEKMINGNVTTTLNYDTNYKVPLTVYLLATTGDDVSFRGYWNP